MCRISGPAGAESCSAHSMNFKALTMTPNTTHARQEKSGSEREGAYPRHSIRAPDFKLAKGVFAGTDKAPL